MSIIPIRALVTLKYYKVVLPQLRQSSRTCSFSRSIDNPYINTPLTLSIQVFKTNDTADSRFFKFLHLSIMSSPDISPVNTPGDYAKKYRPGLGGGRSDISLVEHGESELGSSDGSHDMGPASSTEGLLIGEPGHTGPLANIAHNARGKSHVQSYSTKLQGKLQPERYSSRGPYEGDVEHSSPSFQGESQPERHSVQPKRYSAHSVDDGDVQNSNSVQDERQPEHHRADGERPITTFPTPYSRQPSLQRSPLKKRHTPPPPVAKVLAKAREAAPRRKSTHGNAASPRKDHHRRHHNGEGKEGHHRRHHAEGEGEEKHHRHRHHRQPRDNRTPYQKISQSKDMKEAMHHWRNEYELRPWAKSIKNGIENGIDNAKRNVKEVKAAVLPDKKKMYSYAVGEKNWKNEKFR